LPEGTKILVTSYYGPYQAATVTMAGGAWIDTPTPLNVFDLYETTCDSHGYYWFAQEWQLFDVSAMQVEEATEGASGIVRLASWPEVLDGSLAAVMRPRHMMDYIDRMFVGIVEDFSGTTPPLVWVPAVGQEISRIERPKLWQFAQNSGNIVDDSAWTTSTGKYSTGNGTTTFRVPDLRGEFRRGWDNGRGVDPGRSFGSTQLDAMQNFTGSVGRFISSITDAGTGVLYSTNSAGSIQGGSTNTWNAASVAIDLSRQARTSKETRPRNIGYLPCIYAGAPA
jgi:microcystin-dependent protein